MPRRVRTAAPRYSRARGVLRAVRCACDPPPSSVRTGANVSFVTRPAHVRLHSASMTDCSFSAPVELPQLRGEVRAAARERRERCCSSSEPGASSSSGGCERERRRVGGVQGDPAVAAGQRAVPRPDHLAGRGELVEHRGRVVRDPATAARATPTRSPGSARPRAARSTAATPSMPFERAGDVLPHRQEPREGLLRDRLDAAADRRERAHPQPAQHLGVAPLGLVRPAAPSPESVDAAGRSRSRPGPATSRRCRVSRATATPTPSRSATASAVNGPCVRAYRATRSPSGSASGSRKAVGMPTGSATPSASRRRPASSIAATRATPAMVTGIARRVVDQRARDERMPSASAVASVSLAGAGRRGCEPCAATSAASSGPSIRSRSATPSMPRARRSGSRRCASRSNCAMIVGVEQLPHLDLAEQLGQQRRIDRQRGGAALGERASRPRT